MRLRHIICYPHTYVAISLRSRESPYRRPMFNHLDEKFLASTETEISLWSWWSSIMRTNSTSFRFPSLEHVTSRYILILYFHLCIDVSSSLPVPSSITTNILNVLRVPVACDRFPANTIRFHSTTIIIPNHVKSKLKSFANILLYPSLQWLNVN